MGCTYLITQSRRYPDRRIPPNPNRLESDIVGHKLPYVTKPLSDTDIGHVRKYWDISYYRDTWFGMGLMSSVSRQNATKRTIKVVSAQSRKIVQSVTLRVFVVILIKKGQITMNEIEAMLLRVGHRITSIMGDWWDAQEITHTYPDQEPGMVWVRMVGIWEETHYDVTYRLTPTELVQVV